MKDTDNHDLKFFSIFIAVIFLSFLSYGCANRMLYGGKVNYGLTAGKVSSYPENTSATATDSLLGLDDPGGTPAVNNFPIGAMISSMKLVDTSGTPVVNQYAIFADANTIKGESSATVITNLGLDTATKTDEAETITEDWDFQGSNTIGSIAVDVSPDSDGSMLGYCYSGINAGETIGSGELVYLDSTDEEWKQADANVSGEWPAWGFAKTSETDGNEMLVQYYGVMRNDSWTLTKGSLIYLSETPGGLTQTAPSDTDDCIQPVARPAASSVIVINVNPISGYGKSD